MAKQEKPKAKPKGKIIEFKPEKKKTKPNYTPSQLKAQEKVKKVNKVAVKKIYDAGKAGKEIPTWRKALREAAKEVYK
ncbi:hypothetical protein [Flectobacillus sp. BAB-3569]|uniref:hypothetical protein n=1 Tax=Flectobacillus sp. BAB-3569 TaxID=1509483 RepID=UPI000BA31A6A|nr:hypothetical protein [Flectobacillus sp. BAB-3569]PAC29239.1 hypothetical protein BWI92_16555 [Flectobacillus sp. BAB-3569]